MAIRCAEFTLELVHLQILGVGFHPTDAWGKRPMKPGQIGTRLPSACRLSSSNATLWRIKNDAQESLHDRLFDPRPMRLLRFRKLA